jgi:hypothetical protein
LQRGESCAGSTATPAARRLDRVQRGGSDALARVWLQLRLPVVLAAAAAQQIQRLTNRKQNGIDLFTFFVYPGKMTNNTKLQNNTE